MQTKRNILLFCLGLVSLAVAPQPICGASDATSTNQTRHAMQHQPGRGTECKVLSASMSASPVRMTDATNQPARNPRGLSTDKTSSMQPECSINFSLPQVSQFTFVPDFGHIIVSNPFVSAHAIILCSAASAHSEGFYQLWAEAHPGSFDLFLVPPSETNFTVNVMIPKF